MATERASQITAESSLRREQYAIQIDERAKSHYRRLLTHCDKDLPPDAKGARILTFECGARLGNWRGSVDELSEPAKVLRDCG
jgi:hypothetical protein